MLHTFKGENRMNMNGLRAGVAILLSTFAASASVAEVKEKWSLGGFSHPESVELDISNQVLYVSNLGGAPLDKDGNGYISKLSRDGKMLEPKWVTGMNAPKGMVIKGHTLYVTDIDRLAEIDTRTGKVTMFYEAVGAVFLNDPAVAADGSVYVSDIAKSTIWQLKDGKMSVWLDKDLPHINGLRVIHGNKLLVAGWGKGMHDDGSTDSLGNLFTVDLKTKAIANLGDGRPVGNLDGLERGTKGSFLVTDFVAGGLLRINRDGSFEQLLDLKSGSADLDVIDNGRTAIIPRMLEDTVTAYSVE
jgi:DNA-binding beta-propeller fold protein YncE